MVLASLPSLDKGNEEEVAEAIHCAREELDQSPSGDVLDDCEPKVSEEDCAW